jgi:mannose-6-phosphate isomerase-like protein (cupin superfamily)
MPALSTPIASLGVLHTLPANLTGGQVAAVEHTLPPGLLGAPVHRHSREDELTIVLSGMLGAFLGGEIVTAEAGACVWKPRHQWHTFWNAGTAPLRFVEVLLPGGFDDYFQQLSQLFQAGSCPTPAAMGAIASAFGLDVDLDETGRICQRFGVTLG